MSQQQAPYKIEGRPATIFRAAKNKDNPYVMLDRRPLENQELSFKAKGILAYLMSRPDGWEVSVADLVKRGADGKASIRAGLKELRDAGHMRYTVSREQGRITGWIIEVYELPLLENIGVENPTDEIIDEGDTSQVGDTTMRLSVSGGSPESDFQQVEKQQVENRTQVLSTLSSNDLKHTTTRGEVFKTYEAEIGLITPHIRDAIEDYLDSLHIPPEWMVEAFHIAAEQQKRNWSYCQAILKRWSVEGKNALPPKPQLRGPKHPETEGSRAEFFRQLEKA